MFLIKNNFRKYVQLLIKYFLSDKESFFSLILFTCTRGGVLLNSIHNMAVWPWWWWLWWWLFWTCIVALQRGVNVTKLKKPLPLFLSLLYWSLLLVTHHIFLSLSFIFFTHLWWLSIKFSIFAYDNVHNIAFPITWVALC